MTFNIDLLGWFAPYIQHIVQVENVQHLVNYYQSCTLKSVDPANNSTSISCVLGVSTIAQTGRNESLNDQCGFNIVHMTVLDLLGEPRYAFRLNCYHLGCPFHSSSTSEHITRQCLSNVRWAVS